jgi:hypothetical protein
VRAAGVKLSAEAGFGLLQAFARKRYFIEADQGDLGCPVLFTKIFPFPSDATHPHILRHPGPHKGRFAIVTDVGQGMRWTRAAPKTRALPADGEVVWS